MASSFTYPGVYISEKESGARAIPAAATSIAMFVGMTDKGAFKIPTRVQSLAEYNRQFGETSVGEMADQVRQFFMNGGGDAYIMRIAKNALQASVEIQEETGSSSVLKIIARDVGKQGNQLRVMIDYATSSPERTFNLTAFRSTQGSDGKFVRSETETHQNLSMDSNDSRYVVDYLENNSLLVRAALLPLPAVPVGGTSIGGVVLQSTQATADQNIIDLIGTTNNSFMVGVAGRDPVLAVVDTTAMTTATDPTNPRSRIVKAIQDAYQSAQAVTLGTTIDAVLNAPTGLGGNLLEIKSDEGAVVITPAPDKDIAAVLMLGIASGGIELDQFSPNRPAPSGIAGRLGPYGGTKASADWLSRLWGFAKTARNQVKHFSLVDPGSSASPYADNIALTGTAANAMFEGPMPIAGPLGSLANVRRALDETAAALNGKIGDRWSAERQGVRLTIRPLAAVSPATGIGVQLTTDDGGGGGYDFGAGSPSGLLRRTQSQNIGGYLLGTVAPAGARQVNTVPGADGTLPKLAEYQGAFAIIDSSVEIFNMLVLPRADGQLDSDRKMIWGAASSFAARQRAILFVDPESTWIDIGTAVSGADSAKIGVDTRNSVIYWPKLKIAAPDAPKGRIVDPSGSMAGLYARTDTRFGTWRAPAGIEATLTGVLGVVSPMSDPQNGQINPKALNAIRLFPSGITSWGARMMVGADDTGNIDDKYVPVRRMMLFIENSLYRGLRFAVFKENAEPLWAMIRLAAGSFMNSLMLQGAFASRTKSEAYYVQCDATTTTATDVNLGIVNCVVGFAPNKPAEFVHVIVTQMAGQVDV